MASRLALISLVAALSLSFTGAKANNGWSLGKSDANSDYSKRTNAKATSGLTSDQDINDVKLNDAQKHEAIVWGLSQDEEKTYVLLMKNQSGVYYKDRNLSPIAILGINSTDNSQRLDYAKRDAQYESENTAKLFAWVTAESMAIKKINEGIPYILPFDTSKYDPNKYKAISLLQGDTLMLWTKTTSSMSKIISRFFISESKEVNNIHLNVYFTDENLTKEKIQNWASHNSIPVEMVKKKKITLNFNNGAMKKGDRGLFLIRSGKTTEIDTSRF